MVRDGNFDADQVKIELDRSGPSEEVVNEVTVNQTVFDIGYGTVFVLQVVSIIIQIIGVYRTPM